MSAKLCPIVAPSFREAKDRDKFFAESEVKEIRRLEIRETQRLGQPGVSCNTNLFFGFFFDGTKNNYVLAENAKNHSNVARLYDCFPGLSVPGVLPASTDWQYKPSNYTHFFRTYIPGVSSPFKEIDDSGKGVDGLRGGAMGYRGEARIIWALVQAINNVHRYFLKTPLVTGSELTALIALIDLSARRRAAMKRGSPLDVFNAADREDGKTREQFERILGRLHSALSQHRTDRRMGRPKKVDPGIVQTIHVSIFGFSRGSTQARAFINWLMELGRLDSRMTGSADAMTLCGFKLEIDFLGLFDTVASVGAGNSFGNSWLGKLFDGHGAWADSEGSLRIPDGIRCVHLVAAHEIRRSFPLDSIAVGNVISGNAREIVFPGVHSDLGCGYSPCEQGRGTDSDGKDMITRLPLLYMYKQARISGVPLKLELASPVAQRRFEIAPETIIALNAYLGHCKVQSGALTDIMREQAKLQIQWHLARRVHSKSPLESSQSFARASTFDKNDLHSANREFEAEIAAFEHWLERKGKEFQPKSQRPGFGNNHEKEWEEIAKWWCREELPPEEVLSFFDDYVHDSRAWFKIIPGNPDNEAEMEALLRSWSDHRKKVQEFNALEQKRIASESENKMVWTGRKLVSNAAPYKPLSDGLTDDQRAAAEEYARTGKIPRMVTEGREPFEWGVVDNRAGYLRFRKIYAGSDSVLVSDVGTSTSSDEMPA